MEPFLVLLSGEHIPLALGELRASCEAEHCVLELVTVAGRVALVSADTATVAGAVSRCAHSKSLYAKLYTGGQRLEELEEGLREAMPPNAEGRSLLVRVLSADSEPTPVDVEGWEMRLGGVLARSTGCRVSAENPGLLVQVLLAGGLAFAGLWVCDSGYRELQSRAPARRLFFHPSTLKPKLARCMANLARLRRGEVAMDPFCGAGGIVMECSLLGARMVGMDVQRRMLRGTRKNLWWAGAEALGLIHGDARRIPARGLNAIITDPPYGRLSSTGGVESASLITEFLYNACDALKPGGYLVTLAPSEMGLEEEAEKSGLELLESYYIYVHGGLTRGLYVLRSHS